MIEDSPKESYHHKIGITSLLAMLLNFLPLGGVDLPRRSTLEEAVHPAHCPSVL